MSKTYNHSSIPVKSNNIKGPSKVPKIREEGTAIVNRSKPKNIQEMPSNSQSDNLTQIFPNSNEMANPKEIQNDDDDRINIPINSKSTQGITLTNSKSNIETLQVILQKHLDNVKDSFSNTNEMVPPEKNQIYDYTNTPLKSNSGKLPSKIPKILRSNGKKFPEMFTKQIFTSTTEIVNSKNIVVDTCNKRPSKISKSPNECTCSIYRRRNIRNLQEIFRKRPIQNLKQISFGTKEIQTELFVSIEKYDKESQCSTDDTERNMELTHRKSFRRRHYFPKKKKKGHHRHLKKSNSIWLLNSCILLKFLLSYFRYNLKSVALSKLKNMRSSDKFDKNLDKTNSKYKVNSKSINRTKNTGWQNKVKNSLQMQQKLEDPTREVLVFDNECDTITFRILRMVIFQFQMFALLVIIITIDIPSMNFFPFHL